MKEAKVVLLPLDERPCNFEFPSLLYKNSELKIVRPDELGDKKNPADLDNVACFLEKECANADYAVLAMDTLLYGGLIPSRLHHFSEEEVSGRLALLKKIKENNPKLRIFAFQCIMRCPKYSSGDEEPDYYEECGAEIHKFGAILHKEQLGIEDEETAVKEEVLKAITEGALEDYCERREFNLKQNLAVLQLAKEGIIDFLIIPQDDSAPFGYTAIDQKKVRARINELELAAQVYVYPGADEIELTLLSRVFNEWKNKTPRVFVRYASVKAPYVIPLYEDRPLGETLKYHLMAAGCVQCFSDSDADFILALSAPGDNMQEAAVQPVEEGAYTVQRTLPEFVYGIEQDIKRNIPVTIGDNAYANGGETELLAMLNRKGLLFKLAGYAGWNTSSNTIGTAIAQGVRYLYCGDDCIHREFLILRYVEDVGYCSLVRKKVTDTRLPELGMNYFDVKEQRGVVSEIVKEELLLFSQKSLSSIKDHIEIESVYMPWRRMFEAGINVRYLY